MLNKKRGIATGEIIGLLVFMLGAVTITLFFYGYIISNAQKAYQESKFSKDEIEATKTLNFFLEMDADDERKVVDLTIESYSNEDYTEFDRIAEQHFSPISNNWVLEIYGTDRFHQVKDAPTKYETTGEAFVQLFILKESGDFETILVVLAIGPNRII